MRKCLPVGDFENEMIDRLTDTCPSSDTADIDASLRFYRAVLLMVTGERPEYEAVKERLQKEAAWEPELLLYELQTLHGDGLEGQKERIATMIAYGEYCPQSLWGSDRDDRYAPALKIDPPPPSVPKLDRLSEKLAHMGTLYAKAGFLREAVDASIESVYAASPARPYPELAQQWMTVANLEVECGQDRLAVRAFLKAAYHDAACVKAASEGIDKTLQGESQERPSTSRPGNEETERPEEPVLDTKTALAIAQLYREMNLHPLALKTLVALQKDDDAEVREARQVIEDEWAGIVDRHRRIRGPKCVILGAKVDKVEKWAEIPVRRPSDSFWKPESSVGSRPAEGPPGGTSAVQPAGRTDKGSGVFVDVSGVVW